MSKVNGQRHQVPLADDISAAGGRLRTNTTTGKRKSRSDEDDHGDGYIDARSSRKILAISQSLAEEDAQEKEVATKAAAPNSAFTIASNFGDDEQDDDDQHYDEEGEWLPEEDVPADDLDPEDLAVYSKFLPEGDEIVTFAPSLAKLSTTGDHKDGAEIPESDIGPGESTNLADLILQRIAEKEALESIHTARPIRPFDVPPLPTEIPPKVIDTFTKVGQLLSRYKSGPLPKPFKVLPTLPQWPDLLDLTQPDRWTPNAVFAANRIFKSAPAPVAQHFNSTILLDRVRDDIAEHKKLNVHLYNALKDSLYKPAAFFKGILFPLVSSSCTLREAHIVSSVIARKRVPALHCAAALLRVCEIAAERTSAVDAESAGAANVFIRIILEKKYALPYKAIDALVFHFLRFRRSKETGEEALAGTEAKLPVLWHQCFLVFAQHYKRDITEDQREALLDLLLVRGHREIGPEIRRELVEGRGRGRDEVGGEEREAQKRDDGDDTMDIN